MNSELMLSGPSVSNPRVQSLVAHLEDLLADVEFLLQLLEKVRSKLDLMDAEARAKELALTVVEVAPKFRNNLEQIATYVVNARKAIEDDPESRMYFTGSLTRLENELEKIGDVLPGAEALTAGRLDEIKSSLIDIRSYAGVTSFPTMVQEALSQISPGAAFDFHAKFSRLLPLERDRQSRLEYLQLHPRRYNGVVDVAEGYVYRVSPHAWRQKASFWYILASALLGYGIIYALIQASPLLGLPDFQPSRLGELFRAYTVALMGGIVHLTISFLKQERSKNRKFYWGPSDWLLWIHVRESAFLRSVLSFQIVMIGAAMTIESIDTPTAFFLGYSFDSILDTVFQRFETFAASGRDKVNKMLVDKPSISTVTMQKGSVMTSTEKGPMLY